MMLLKEKQQLVICVIAVTMAAAFVFGRYLPLYARKKAATRQRNEQSAVIAQGDRDRLVLPKFQEKLASDTSAISNYDAQIPEERQLGEFLKAASAMMNELKLQEPLIQPGQETRSGELNVIPLDIRCKGTLEQLFAFFTEFQRMPRMIRIEEVSLVNDRNYQGQVTMITKAAIYSGRPEKNVKVAVVD